jgi:hypothetical protein
MPRLGRRSIVFPRNLSRGIIVLLKSQSLFSSSLMALSSAVGSAFLKVTIPLLMNFLKLSSTRLSIASLMNFMII